MIFKYSQKNRKAYVFKDLDAGETFMFSDPRKGAMDFEKCPVYIVVEDLAHAVNLNDGRLLYVDSNKEVYPVICECSVSLYPDVY